MTTPMISKLKETPRSSHRLQIQKVLTLYRQIIGSLMYLVHTRPDICYAVNALSQFMCEPKSYTYGCSKTYPKICLGDYSLWSQIHIASGGVMTTWLSQDSDWMGNAVDRKSTSRYCFSVSFSYDFLVQQETWLGSPKALQRQSTLLLVLLAEKQCGSGSYFQTYSGQSLNPQLFTVTIQSCIKLTVNPVFHDRSKHIEMIYHYIRDMIQKKVFNIQYVLTAEQTTNIFHQATVLDKVCIPSWQAWCS